MMTHDELLPDAQVTEFQRWYSNQRRRSTGRLPAKTTLRNKAVHLNATAKLVASEFPGTVSGMPEVVSDRAVFQWVRDTMESRWSLGSVRNLVYALKDYAAFAEAVGLIEASCITDIDVPPKNPAPTITIYTEEEMDLFCRAAWGRGVRWGVFINLLAFTGRRVGELLSVEYQWLRLHEQPPHIALPWTKNGNQDYMVLTPSFVERVLTPANLREMAGEERTGASAFRRDASQYLFPWGYGTVVSRFRRFCRTLGVENRGFHNFRHTVITNRIADGVPIQAVATLAGHANVGQTWSRYNHASALSFAAHLE